MNVAAYQQKKENEKTGKRERQEKKRKNSRPISKKLRTALLRSFKGQLSEKKWLV